MRRCHELLFALDGTWPGHHDDFAAPDYHLAIGRRHADQRRLRMELATGQLVRLGDLQHLLDTVQPFQHSAKLRRDAAQRAGDA